MLNTSKKFLVQRSTKIQILTNLNVATQREAGQRRTQSTGRAIVTHPLPLFVDMVVLWWVQLGLTTYLPAVEGEWNNELADCADCATPKWWPPMATCNIKINIIPAAVLIILGMI